MTTSSLPSDPRQAPLAYLGELRPAFVAHLADRLADQIGRQCGEIDAATGVSAPNRTHSVVLFLADHGPASLAEIARLDGQAHQLLAARLAPLEQMGLVERVDDPGDARRRPYRLTRAGRREADQIRGNTRRIAAAMRSLSDDLGIDLMAVLERAGALLHESTLAQRIDLLEGA